LSHDTDIIRHVTIFLILKIKKKIKIKIKISATGL